ncbi:hypothetical protein CCMA1212_003450 [Trichoderma ghanense]|uniref:Uncharacterized protein n=1 Tax=Trichoderma ghanense TaxID=65468 RepID=A0ABY2HAR9_9HYPO
MPTARKRPAKLQASSSSQSDSVPVNESGPHDAPLGPIPAAETEIHAQSDGEESTQLATAVLVQNLAEELPKAASTRPAEI